MAQADAVITVASKKLTERPVEALTRLTEAAAVLDSNRFFELADSNQVFEKVHALVPTFVATTEGQQALAGFLGDSTVSGRKIPLGQKPVICDQERLATIVEVFLRWPDSPELHQWALGLLRLQRGITPEMSEWALGCAQSLWSKSPESQTRKTLVAELERWHGENVPQRQHAKPPVQADPLPTREFRGTSFWKIVFGIGCGILFGGFLLVVACTALLGTAASNVEQAKKSKTQSLNHLIVNSLSGERSSSYSRVNGYLLNNSAGPVEFVKVICDLLTEEGRVLDTDWTYGVGGAPLYRGDSKKFSLSFETHSQGRFFRCYVEGAEGRDPEYQAFVDN